MIYPSLYQNVAPRAPVWFAATAPYPEQYPYLEDTPQVFVEWMKDD